MLHFHMNVHMLCRIYSKKSSRFYLLKIEIRITISVTSLILAVSVGFNLHFKFWLHPISERFQFVQQKHRFQEVLKTLVCCTVCSKQVWPRSVSNIHLFSMKSREQSVICASSLMMMMKHELQLLLWVCDSIKDGMGCDAPWFIALLGVNCSLIIRANRNTCRILVIKSLIERSLHINKVYSWKFQFKVNVFSTE